jgi:arsenate reductase
VAAQVAGGLFGVLVANLMFDLDAVSVSAHDRGGTGHLLGEVVATMGLVLVVFGTLRSTRPETVAFAVGGYIAAAYWFTSSTSFANPAVTIGRMLSDTFAGIAPESVPGFIGAQLLGGLLAIALVRWLYPRIGDRRDQTIESRTQEPPLTPTTGRTPQVVFACVRNGGRSVISRVLTEHYARGAVTALSAGTQPGEHIHAEVADVLEKLGLDTSKEQPKLLTRATIAASDLAITLGCGEECPYVPGVRYVDWPVDDPGGQDEATVRAIVADLDGRVRNLIVELVPDIELPPSVLAKA